MARHCVCSGTASMIGSVRRCLTSVTALSGQMEDKEGLKLRIQRLLAAKSGIKEALHRHKDELAAMRECTLPPLELILTLANNITSTHAAPAGWVEGTPLIKSHPPAPQLVDMREGFLAKYNAEYVKSHGGGEADVDVQADASAARSSEQDAVANTKRKVEILEQFLQQKKGKLSKGNGCSNRSNDNGW
jgi:hypothetical protein